MTSVIPNRGRFSAASLTVTFVATLLIIATPPGVATPHRERWQWPTGRPVTVVEGFAPPAHDWLPGRRGVTLHCDRCRSHRGQGRHFDSARGRRPRRLVDVSARYVIRRGRRSRSERGRHRRRRRGFTHAALGRKDRQAHVHRSNTYDARASATPSVGRGIGPLTSRGMPRVDMLGNEARAPGPRPLRSGVRPLIDRAQTSGIHVGVALSCRQRRVTEHLLDRTQVGSTLQQVRRR